jgi:phenylalanine ammonia-lyase
LIGHHPSFHVLVHDSKNHTLKEIDCLQGLEHVSATLGTSLQRIELLPKEGLALVNGTSMSTGMAANCVYDAWLMLALTLGAHALIIQGLRGSAESFHPFIHESKGHPGQSWVAEIMRALLDESGLLLKSHQEQEEPGKLFQDRYSLRCLAQFIGPVVEGLMQITRQVQHEINSASDNPLYDHKSRADPETHGFYHGGNFLGQYVGVAMDQVRYYLSLLAKHLDAQIALLVEPLFSNDLPASLVGNVDRPVNMGLKGLQLAGNAIMPMISFLANSIADRFPTHAEQFNQNINSQAFGSAYFTRQTIELYRQYIAIALMFGVQSVDLRTRKIHGHCDASEALSLETRPLYDAVRRVVGDHDRPLDKDIAAIAGDLAKEGEHVGEIRGAVLAIRQKLEGMSLDVLF